MKIKFIGLLFLSSVLLSACSNPFNELADQINAWIAGEEVDDESPTENQGTDTNNDNTNDDTDDVSGKENEEVDSSNESDTNSIIDYSHLYGKGQETALESGVHTVGKDIEAGRYEVTSNDYMSVRVKNADDISVYSDSLNGSSEDSHDKLIVFLDEDYTVEVDDYSGSSDASVDFQPYETTEKTELTPGQWVVGEDFPAGVYDIEVDPTDSYGDLVISRRLDSNRARFLLGSEDYGGVLEITTNLEEGELVTLNYIKSARMTKR